MLLNLVDIEAGQQVINKIKENNIPVIVYNREPISIVPIKSYDKAIYIGNDSKEGGILQGQILVDTWNDKKEIIDKNGDGIMQYIMLSGGIDNKEALGRTIYSVKTIENAGIKTEELALRVANFDKELARKAIESLFNKYGNKIEVIISNDDTMAVGAIEALQAKGYNIGDEYKTIPVVGFDKEEKAKELIEKGFMTGTVIQNPYKTAEALYIVGMNLVFRRNAFEGTPYVFDDTGVSIRIPYEGIFVKTSS
jgi:methyl-galactoside transport system substrate-binding protein